MDIERGGTSRGVERFMFFSDAVFAIAITLLVIDLRVPTLELTDAELADSLRGIARRVFAYVLSFAVVGIYWHAHWRGFLALRRVDARLMTLNLLLLGTIAFIPFPTALIGEYGDRPLAVAVYAVSLSLAGVLGPLTWLHAERSGLNAPAMSVAQARVAAIRAFALPAVMLASLALLPFAPTSLVEMVWFSMVPIQIVLSRVYR